MAAMYSPISLYGADSVQVMHDLESGEQEDVRISALI